MTWEVMTDARVPSGMRRLAPCLSLCLGVACGGEPAVARPAPTAPVASPSAPTIAAPDRAPDLVTPVAAYWLDAHEGTLARAPRDGAMGELEIIVRGRRAPGHLAREADGDLYWTEYRREDARCDFVRLPVDGAPLVLFEDALGDFAEEICETDVAVDDARIYWLHGSEIRAARHDVTGAASETLVTGEAFPRALLVADGRVYWTTLGGDPYEDDLTGRGALRAMPTTGGEVLTIASDLTEPSAPAIADREIVVTEGEGTTRRYPLLR